jgi:hypothetical protein
MIASRLFLFHHQQNNNIMEHKKIDPSTISGWGIDADPKDTPNYPIKHYTGDDHNRSNWERPALQAANVEILKSTERPNLSAVFGSNNPPRGLSGVLRRIAFTYSENMYRHWLPLLVADRIDVIEAELGDLLHGVLPRLASERGWAAIGKHNPGLLARKILIRLVILGTVAALVAYHVKKNRQESLFNINTSNK